MASGQTDMLNPFAYYFVFLYMNYCCF